MRILVAEDDATSRMRARNPQNCYQTIPVSLAPLSDAGRPVAMLEAFPEATGRRDASPVEKVADALERSCGNMRALKMSTICAEPQDKEPSGSFHAL